MCVHLCVRATYFKFFCSPQRSQAMANLLNPDVVDMGFAARKLLTEYNMKPILTRPQHSFYTDNHTYFEIDMDVHVFSYIARKGLSMIRCVQNQGGKKSPFFFFFSFACCCFRVCAQFNFDDSSLTLSHSNSGMIEKMVWDLGFTIEVCFLKKTLSSFTFTSIYILFFCASLSFRFFCRNVLFYFFFLVCLCCILLVCFFCFCCVFLIFTHTQGLDGRGAARNNPDRGALTSPAACRRRGH